MIVYLLSILLSTQIFVVHANFATNTQPSVEVLDDEFLLVDYSKSFNITDFSKIRTASVLSENYNYGIAAKDDYAVALDQANKGYQKLAENTKLKVNLNPCVQHSFRVRLISYEYPTIIDSIQSMYVPDSMEQVVLSNICMADDSLYVPIQKMKDESPLIAACMHTLFVNNQKLVEGYNNTIEGHEDTFDITITKNGYKEEKIKFNKEELMKKNCQTNSALIIVCVVVTTLIMIIIIKMGIINFQKKKKKNQDESEGIDMNPDYGEDCFDVGESEVKDASDYYFDDNPEDIAEVTDKNDYYNIED